MPSRNRNVLMIVTVAIMVAGLVYMGIVAKRWIDPYDGSDFDRLVWDADPGGYERAAMCTDIIDRHLQPNIALDQIADLLGESFEDRDRSHFQDGDLMPGVRTIAYWVGPCSWMGYDDAFLFVHLDENDRLVSASVYGY